MLSASRPAEQIFLSPGQERELGASTTSFTPFIQITPNLGLEASAPSRYYPSPPMSGTPPRQSDKAQEASGLGQARGDYPIPSPQDAYRRIPFQNEPADARTALRYPFPPPIPYQQEPAPTGGHAQHRRSDEPLPPPPVLGSFHSHQPQRYLGGLPPHPYGSLPSPGASSSYRGPAGPSRQEKPYTSPKSQRRTKGHVASACVPCKKAHLRCDALRPCSRCVSNGKQDACHDVVHKKRGRPRLRDEKDVRYDPARLPLPHNVVGRRPLSIHPAVSTGDPMTPKYVSRNVATDGSLYAPLLPLSSRSPEPVAYLSMDMTFVRVSPTFIDAIGGFNVKGRSLDEVLMSNESRKVSSLRDEFRDEQKRREPNYLPPIMAGVDEALQALGFSTEEVSRYQLGHHEYLTFAPVDGHPLPHHVRMSLAKEGSHYFVVILLNRGQQQFPYLPQPQHAQDPRESYHPHSATSQLAFSPSSVGLRTLDQAHSRHGESALPTRQQSAVPASQMGTYVGHSVRGGTSSYASAASHPEYGGHSSHPSLQGEPLQAQYQGPQPPYQLPPIRAQHEQKPPQGGEQGWHRGERSGRVDIGGLIEWPEEQGRPR